MKALLFSCHAEETTVLKIILQQAGFNVEPIKKSIKTIESWYDDPADLVLAVLDNDSKKDIEQILSFRAQTTIPFIIIIDHIAENFHVELLEKGIDLVVLRPFSVRVLLAQIRNLLRRFAGMPYYSLPILTKGKLTLDPGTRTVKIGVGQPKRLTQLEFRLLNTLMINIGHIIPTENIVEYVWGYTGEGNRELVRGLIQRLRSKVEPDPKNPRFIMTEPGIGYYFNQFVE
ncbi:MAG: response regulator transcription factor [Anaerolineaceae bacterium]|nr:response regulator transcription factor [Anaerolineaceae bacterium]